MWAPAIITLITVIFGAGNIYGRIGDQEKTLKRHDDTLIDHRDQLDRHELELAEGRGWKRGYDAGKKDHDL
jgi:hypothetical protein